jgi:ketosteroid isomerase-like protein
MTETGKYVTIYRKGADGSWKAIQDINNADAPAK